MGGGIQCERGRLPDTPPVRDCTLKGKRRKGGGGSCHPSAVPEKRGRKEALFYNTGEMKKKETLSEDGPERKGYVDRMK